MPAQLYHNLQTSFIDALFCCAKSKVFSPDEPLYLVLDGTDLEERFFGNVRMKFKGGNYNTLELINSTCAMVACDRMLMVDHQEWLNKNHVQRRLALDYSNTAIWKRENLTLKNVNIKSIWKSGYYFALSIIPEDAIDKMEETRTTLRCPIKQGVVVGVKNADKDWSRDDIHDNDVVSARENEKRNDDESDHEELDINFAEMLSNSNHTSDPFFMIDGKKVYKTTCLKTISKSEELSRDRL